MKWMALFSLLISIQLHSSTKLEETLQKVEKKLYETSTDLDVSNHESGNEQQFWLAVVKAYDHLKAYNLTERYNFIYEAGRILSHPSRTRSGQLNTWLNKEDRKVSAATTNASFKETWKTHVKNIRLTMHGLDRKNTTAGRSNTRTFFQELKHDLTVIREQERNLLNQNQNLIEGQKQLTQKVDATVKAKVSNPVPMGSSTSIPAMFIFFGLISCGVILLTSRKKQTHGEVTVLPPIPSLSYEMAEATQEKVDDHVDPEEQINIEEQYLKVIQDNEHLLSAVDLTFSPYTQSPFKTNVKADREKLNEALNSFLKGTLAIIKSSSKKASDLSWSCTESDGRVFLELTIHGIDCNEKTLYYNALIDGFNSAPAHFGRVEKNLEDHAASVAIHPAHSKLKLSLGMDAAENVMKYC